MSYCPRCGHSHGPVSGLCTRTTCQCKTPNALDEIERLREMLVTAEERFSGLAALCRRGLQQAPSHDAWVEIGAFLGEATR